LFFHETAKSEDQRKRKRVNGLHEGSEKWTSG